MARILVIDDDANVRGMLRRVLEHGGHDVVAAADGRAGFEAQRDEQVDLIITDIFMPGEDGLALIRRLRKHSPGIKVIVISGGDTTGTLDMTEHAKLLGARRVLQKPFEVGEVLNAVRAVLDEP